MKEEEQKPPSLEAVDLWLWRGYAIGAYSMFEQALCQLFKELMSTTDYRAALIFFQIYNARARNTIIGKLLKDHFGNTYNLFWNSMFTHFKQLDDKRNSIVHWATIYKFSISTPIIPVPERLVPPNLWGISTDASHIFLNDLKEFIYKTQILGSIVGQFNSCLCAEVKETDAAVISAWQDIFLQELVYPLPDSHLLFQTSHKRQSPPPPSPA